MVPFVLYSFPVLFLLLAEPRGRQQPVYRPVYVIFFKIIIKSAHVSLTYYFIFTPAAGKKHSIK